MTEPLLNLPAPASVPSPASTDGPRANAGGEFDGMLRQQMKDADPGQETKPSASADSTPQEGVSKGTAGTAPEVDTADVQAEHVLELLSAEEPADGSVPVVVEADGGIPTVPAPRLAEAVAAAVPGTAADENATDLEILEELAPRTSRDGDSARAVPVTGKASSAAAPKVTGSPSVPAGGEPVPRAAAEGAPRAEPAMPGPAESDSAEAPGLVRTGSPATAVQAVASFATTLQSASSAIPRAQVLEPVMVPVADPQWGAAVGSRLAISVARGVQSASIALNPQELGPLQLTLVVKEDEASVTFVSNHAAVRDAIEIALPRLREMLAQEGITLTDVEVFSGGERSGEGREGMTGGRAADDAGEEDSGPAAEVHRVAAVRDSLVDTFA